jgi:excisionase family DNA binding protein
VSGASLSAGRQRVAQIREVAIADSFALVGVSAHFLGRLLTGYPGGLERLLARSGIPPERRDDVLRAVGALVHVGANWRLEHEASSGSGTSPSAVGDPRALSQRVGFSPSSENGETSPSSSGSSSASMLLGTSEVAGVLGVSPRFVRRLASTGALPGQRDAGGRWQFAAADVAAERARRMSGRGRTHAAA